MRQNMMAEITSAQKADRAQLRSSDAAEEIVIAIITGSALISDYASGLFETISIWCNVLRKHFHDNVIRRTPESLTWDDRPILPPIPSFVIKLIFDLYPRDTRILHQVAGDLAKGKPQAVMFGGTKVRNILSYFICCQAANRCNA